MVRCNEEARLDSLGELLFLAVKGIRMEWVIKTSRA